MRFSEIQMLQKCVKNFKNRPPIQSLNGKTERLYITIQQFTDLNRFLLGGGGGGRGGEYLYIRVFCPTNFI